eukprot:1195791-Prorocentrum_minimum.AAC.14
MPRRRSRPLAGLFPKTVGSENFLKMEAVLRSGLVIGEARRVRCVGKGRARGRTASKSTSHGLSSSVSPR